uniref:leishmanolysin-like peptidase isoform X3 n=1 Tax=Callithrix jacchus TaxID=9483 RepID=UPI0023DD58A9|nr:leishmanolysin-like peptidase isoform X3 [Callithrix jacchus]
MVTTLGPKMAAEWGGGAGYWGTGPGRSRWRWSGSLWVRSVLLLLGGLRASATSTPVSLGSSPPCRHHVPSDTEVINKVHLKANHVVKRDVDEHLRIKTVYDKSVEELLPEKKNLVKNKLFPQAISYLEKTFQVRRPAGTILLSRQCATNQYLRKENDPHRYCTGECAVHTKCGPVIVPEEHLQQCRVYRGGKWPHGAVGAPDQEGIPDADFVLYVGALATERCSHENIISYAAYCQQEANMDSLGLYQWSDKVVRKVERLWDVRDNKIIPHTVYLLVTPRVVEEARKHFNCPVLEGMELENQGGMGTELNHWEKRLLENEAMTGSHTQNRVLSRITLALMEDTGWYKANYSMAEKLDWGRGMGCDFVRKSCKFWIDQQRHKRQMLSPYCDTLRSNPLQLTCRQDQRAVAVCNLQKFPKPLPQEYQYFDELTGIPAEDLPYYGGSVEIADYCPFSQEFSWHLSGEYQRNSDCRILENQPEIFKNYGAEKYGPHSVCLIQKSAFVMEKCERKLSYPDWGSGCYQVSCSSQGLKVWVQDTSYLCSRAGQVLPVSIQMNGWIHDGNLLCPSCWDFCEVCPPETDPPAANLTRALPLDLCSCSSSLVATLWLLLGNLFPLLAGFLLCVWH